MNEQKIRGLTEVPWSKDRAGYASDIKIDSLGSSEKSQTHHTPILEHVHQSPTGNVKPQAHQRAA
jgi:hypothetical protein